jgi:hypothetical protein
VIAHDQTGLQPDVLGLDDLLAGIVRMLVIQLHRRLAGVRDDPVRQRDAHEADALRRSRGRGDGPLRGVEPRDRLQQARPGDGHAALPECPEQPASIEEDCHVRCS